MAVLLLFCTVLHVVCPTPSSQDVAASKNWSKLIEVILHSLKVVKRKLVGMLCMWWCSGVVFEWFEVGVSFESKKNPVLLGKKKNRQLLNGWRLLEQEAKKMKRQLGRPHASLAFAYVEVG